VEARSSQKPKPKGKAAKAKAKGAKDVPTQNNQDSPETSTVQKQKGSTPYGVL